MMSTWQDGFEMSRELKKDPELKSMPILMLTGIKDKTGIDFKSAAGDPTWCPVDGFLEKPVEPNTLLSEVERLLPRES
jgi:CheY-like chemotaxis protein